MLLILMKVTRVTIEHCEETIWVLWIIYLSDQDAMVGIGQVESDFLGRL